MAHQFLAGKEVGVGSRRRVETDAGAKVGLEEEDRDAPAAGKRHTIRLGGIDLIHLSLPGGEHGEFDSMMCQGSQSLVIYRCLRQPHALWHALEAVLEVGDPPGDLDHLIRGGGQR